MKTATVAELESKLSQYLKAAEQGDIIILADGKPKAVIHTLAGEELEDYIISHSPAVKAEVEKAYQDYMAHGGCDLNELLAKVEK